MKLLMISSFGVVGILARYGLDKVFENRFGVFPASTFLINIVGSFRTSCRIARWIYDIFCVFPSDDFTD